MLSALLSGPFIPFKFARTEVQLEFQGLRIFLWLKTVVTEKFSWVMLNLRNRSVLKV